METSPHKGWTVLILLQLMIVLAGAQTLSRCNNDTMLDYAKSDPDLALTAAWAKKREFRYFIGKPLHQPGESNVTESNVGQGDQAELAVYNIIEGLYSPDDLVNLTSVNSILGMLKQQDYVIRAFKDANGDLYLEGMTDNNVVKVLEVKQNCNGWAYVVEKALMPAARDSQIFSRYGDGAIVAQLYANGSTCLLDIPQYVAANMPDTEQWQLVWNNTKMNTSISNKLLSATILVPENGNTIKGFSATAASVLYNMVYGEFCPGELASLAQNNGGSITKNSMLGVVTGRDLPLKFSNESGTLTITGEFGSARVLSHTVGCQSVLLKTDVPLRPPPSAASTPAPAVLPTPLTRHLTCNPVVYLNDPASDAESSAPASPPSSSSSSSSSLAVGLGVGLGCAAILAAAAGFFLYRKRKNANTTTVYSSKSTTAYNSSNLNSNTWSSVPASSVLASLHTNPTPTAASLPGDTTHYTARAISTTPDVAAIYGEFLDLDLDGYDDDEEENDTKDPQQLSKLRSTELAIDMWEIDPLDIQIIVDNDANPVELGRGSFGAVYRGVLRGVQPAAVKVLNASVGSDAQAAFEREAAILKHVNRDKNVVQLYGTSKMPDGKLLLVTELMEGGDLRRALNDPVTAEALAWHRNGKTVALDITRGLTALHAVNVVHRDLKSKNVLLTDTLTAKVADVGIAAIQSQGYLTASAGNVIGTLAWSAPELLLGKRCTQKVDIYSLGIVLWEIATGGVPQRGFTQPPPPSERCPAELALLIRSCTAPNPRLRPTAREVYEQILLIPPVGEP